MKTKFILIASYILMAILPAFSQLKVASNGKVGIGLPNDTTPLSNLSIGAAGQPNTMLYLYKAGRYSQQYGVHSLMETKAANGWTSAIVGSTIGKSRYSVGVKGEAISILVPTSYTYGVYGRAGGAANGRNYGVYGLLQVANGEGSAIYGTNDSVDHIILGRYAGFFRGKTRVNGDFYATTVNTTSDIRLKTNISNVEYTSIAKLQNLRPVQFVWKKQEIKNYDNEEESLSSISLSSDIDTERLHYGFIAQELQAMFPELVHEDKEGYLSINYLELIPLMVQSIQELTSEVAELKGEYVQRMPRSGDMQNNNGINDMQAVLYQNNPNPFTMETRIDYLLPATTQSATLYIYNMNGSQITEYPIETLGKGYVIVSANSLNAGMYLYSLIADGQVIDTKRMILTK